MGMQENRPKKKATEMKCLKNYKLLQNQPKKMMSNLIWISKLIKKQKRAKIIRKQKNLSYKSPLKKCTKIIKLKKITFQYCTTYYKHTSYICLFSMNSFFFVRTIKMPKMAKKNTSLKRLKFQTIRVEIS